MQKPRQESIYRACIHPFSSKLEETMGLDKLLHQSDPKLIASCCLIPGSPGNGDTDEKRSSDRQGGYAQDWQASSSCASVPSLLGSLSLLVFTDP